MIDDSDRLKPCPFCGGAAEMGCVRSESGEEPNEGGYFIACLACDASTGLRFACGDDPKPLLIEQWNRRTALAQQAEQQEPCEPLEVLKRALEIIAVGDSKNPQQDAADALIDIGFWSGEGAAR